MIGKLGMPELLIIAFIALLIFGPSKIGSLGKSLGEGIRGFKDAIKPEDEKPAEPAPSSTVTSSTTSVNSASTKN